MWMEIIESSNEEFNYFSTIENQLIKNVSVANNIKAMRRKNILMMAALCKYEQELKTEYDYGKVDYDENRLKHHEKKRELFLQFTDEYKKFKIAFLNILKTYRRS